VGRSILAEKERRTPKKPEEEGCRRGGETMSEGGERMPEGGLRRGEARRRKDTGGVVRNSLVERKRRKPT